MKSYSRNYVRIQREKAIKRKKNIILNNWHDYDWINAMENKHHIGMLSKGKIHCSCPLCAAKTNRKAKRPGGTLGRQGKNWKYSDLRRFQKEYY